ncbi:MAG TPA: ribonuclease P protein subunit [Nitrososphaeraceae archaeon]|jgi:ribonuclease P protein subunit POP4|nr:ribonuclease P protein subunit [Nitrososphaeraceae archaeon]
MITAQNIIFHELIGLRVEIKESPDVTLLNLAGKIVFETRNMLIIKTSRGFKKIAKSVAEKIKLFLPSGAVCFISGPCLIGRAEDRVLRIQ